MSRILAEWDWTALQNMDIEGIWMCISGKLKELVGNFVPLARDKTKGKNKAPWWHKNLGKEVKKKHRAWNEYIECETEENHKKYTSQRSKTTLKIRKARQEFENLVTDSLKQAPKKLYEYIRSQQKVHAVVGPLKNSRGRLTENDEDTADVLQAFFQSVFTKESSDKVPSFPRQLDSVDVLMDIDISVEQAREELKNLKSDNASGPDGMSSSV